LWGEIAERGSRELYIQGRGSREGELPGRGQEEERYQGVKELFWGEREGWHEVCDNYNSSLK